MRKIIYYTIIIAFISCNKIDYCDNSMITSLSTKSSISDDDLKSALFSEQANIWIKPSSDPYKLSSFRDILSSISKEVSDTLSATHYALRIYPKSLEEQAELERDSRVKVAYYPFNYIPYTTVQCEELDRTIGRRNAAFPDLRKFCSIEQMEGEDGAIIVESMPLPVLYVVWPVELLIPSSLDYEFDYEVFIPDVETRENEYIREAEIRAQNTISSSRLDDKEIRASGSRVFRGYIVNYDNLLDSNLAMANLRVRFQLGSNIVETYTNVHGRFSLTAPYGSTFSLLFLHLRWKITESNSSVPIEANMGTISDYWVNDQNVLFASDECAVHRALSHYFMSVHPIDVPDSQYMLLAKMTRNTQSWSGEFDAPLFSAPYIKISNNSLTDHGRTFAVVSHELGHYSHYSYKNNRHAYNSMHKLFKESFADYVSWVLSYDYYLSQAGSYSQSNNWDIHFLNNYQSWTVNSYSKHSPLFIDLRDDYNQFYMYSNSGYNYDSIEDVPHSIIKSLVTDNNNWSQIKSQMQGYIGTYYTQYDYNQFVVPYDTYF